MRNPRLFAFCEMAARFDFWLERKTREIEIFSGKTFFYCFFLAPLFV
jgi:hypothetical protein